MGKQADREAGALTHPESMPNPAGDTGAEAPGTPPPSPATNGGTQ
jgi:hypothetical protein